MKKMSIFLFLGLVICSCYSFRSSFSNDEEPPKITKLKFGSITVNGKKYEKDLVFENGIERQRKKGPSKAIRAKYGHTPLTTMEDIPWDCDVLVIGKGMSNRLPITGEFKEEANRRGVELIILKTPDAVDYYLENFNDRINAIFHITC